MDETDETVLVRDARQGSRLAAGRLFALHAEDAWRLAFYLVGDRAAADDIAQDAWERAFRRLNSFEERASFRTWLRRIVANRAMDHLRRERRRPDRECLTEGAGARGGGGDDEQSAIELRAAIARLTPERRAVVVLHHWVGLSVVECAAVLGVPTGTAASRLSRAMADLRDALEVTR